MNDETKNWFKDMSFLEKMEYIWDYYKVHILVGFFIIFILVAFINTMVNKKEYILNIALLGQYIDYDKEAKFDKEITQEIIGNSNGKKQAFVDFYRLIKDSDGTYVLDAPSFEKLMVRIGSGQIDVMIVDKKYFNIFVDQGAFLCLNDLKDLDLEKLHLAEVNSSLKIKPGVYGIYIDNDNKYLDYLGYDYKNKIIVIMNKDQHKELSIKFIKWLLNIK